MIDKSGLFFLMTKSNWTMNMYTSRITGKNLMSGYTQVSHLFFFPHFTYSHLSTFSSALQLNTFYLTKII